jgi:oligopeptide/dipeptide ABC transporter ATP-binding protein
MASTSTSRAGDLGLVGESGSGKSTTGRMLVRLIEPEPGRSFRRYQTSRSEGGAVAAGASPLPDRLSGSVRRVEPADEGGSLVAEPLAIHGIGTRAPSAGSGPRALSRKSGWTSAPRQVPARVLGGQRQRIGIARAIACEPRFVVADEPVSALDPSIQAQIVNLMVDFQERRGLAYLFIAHDLALVRHVARRVAVMYLGKIVEERPRGELYASPATRTHERFWKLRRAATHRPPAARVLPGELPSPVRPPSGCPFHPRCPIAEPMCSREVPLLLTIGEGRRVSCHLAMR